MSYKTVIIDYAPKTKSMSSAIESKANEMAENGYKLVTMSVTNSAKAILVFKTADEQTESSDGKI